MRKMSYHFSQHSNTKVLLLFIPAVVPSKINASIYVQKTIGGCEDTQRGKRDEIS